MCRSDDTAASGIGQIAVGYYLDGIRNQQCSVPKVCRHASKPVIGILFCLRVPNISRDISGIQGCPLLLCNQATQIFRIIDAVRSHIDGRDCAAPLNPQSIAASDTGQAPRHSSIGGSVPGITQRGTPCFHVILRSRNTAASVSHQRQRAKHSSAVSLA